MQSLQATLTDRQWNNDQTENTSRQPTLRKLKEVFSNALADTKTPLLILPNRTDTTNFAQHNYNFV